MVGVFAILKIQEGTNKEFESAARQMEEAVKKNESVVPGTQNKVGCSGEAATRPPSTVKV